MYHRSTEIRCSIFPKEHPWPPTASRPEHDPSAVGHGPPSSDGDLHRQQISVTRHPISSPAADPPSSIRLQSIWVASGPPNPRSSSDPAAPATSNHDTKSTPKPSSNRSLQGVPSLDRSWPAIKSKHGWIFPKSQIGDGQDSNTSGRNPKQRRPASSRQASTRLHPSKAQIWPFVTHHRPPDLGSDLRSSHPQISPNRPIRQINDHQAPSAAPIAASSVQGINRAASQLQIASAHLRQKPNSRRLSMKSVFQ
ncbi:hypothetical protein ACLOJK_004855 [Asimina triloba]